MSGPTPSGSGATNPSLPQRHTPAIPQGGEDAVSAAIDGADAAGITSKMSPEEKNLNVRDALAFLSAVRNTFTDDPEVYNNFLDIMKDFKTQRINTPGVIDRVSALFKDHVELIQNFNTFLPIGYRIQIQGPSQEFPGGSLVVSTPNDRVEYKSGQATDLQNHGQQALAGEQRAKSEDKPTIQSEPTSAADSQRQQPALSTLAQPSSEPQEPPGAPSQHQPTEANHQPAQTSILPGSQPPRPHQAADSAAAAAASSRLAPPSAAAAAPAAPQPVTPVNDGSESFAPTSEATPAIRAMPEFNHAVDFVNRIKARFQDGSTYPQFLSILQYYQMERKSIHEVHQEVTELFSDAPDLLNDFKTFLPERMDNQPGLLLGGAGAPPPPPPHQPHQPAPLAHQAQPAAHRPAASRQTSAMPQAAPSPSQPPASGSTKRKRDADQQQQQQQQSASRASGAAGGGPLQPRPVKRPSDHSEGRPTANGNLAGHPSHRPNMAELDPGYSNMRTNGADATSHQSALQPPPPPPPAAAVMPPPHPGRVVATAEEHVFFDKVARYLEDHDTYQEFLKVLNLYSQEIIDLPTLVTRGQVFLGNAPELYIEFRNIVGWKDDTYYKGNKIVQGKLVIENVPARKQESVRNSLDNAETSGPSYRKLPESARNVPCSGRDALCNEVLNDTWVCHSSAAYEEGFIPTPKNEWEQAMHAVEEERYEYDYYIEANLRTISLLEPIINRIQQMQPHEREAFCLKPGLGGQSKSIYQGTIKKIYGNENGQQVITALHDNPVVAAPLVMSRLKQKDEEWKRALREWSRVWRDADRKNFYKSLDPQGVNLRVADKKISPKSLVSEIETIRREQQQVRLARARGSLLPLPPAEQLAYNLGDDAIFFDVVRLVISYLDRSTIITANDKARIENFLRPFLSSMFAIDKDSLDAFLTPPERPSPADAGSDAGSDTETASQAEESTAAAPAPTSRRGPKKTKKEIADLRRRTLQRTAANRGRRGRGGGAAHSTVSSREGTPDVEVPSEVGTPDPSTSRDSPEPSSAGEMMDLDIKEPVPATAGGLQGMEGVETVSAGALDGASRSSTPTPSEAPPSAPAPEPKTTRATAAAGAAKESASSYQARTAHLKDLSWSRQYYNFFCGTPHYCLLRVFEIIIFRLQKMRDAAVAIAVNGKGASYSISEDLLQEVRKKPNSKSNMAYQIYCRMLNTVEQHWDAPSSSEARLEDDIRKMFGVSGFWFYTIDKLMALLCKFALNSVAEEDHEHIFDLLRKDRQMPSPTEAQIISYRKNVQITVGQDENLYRICWEPRRYRLSFQLLGKDELQKADEEPAQERWESYMTQYMALDETPSVEKTMLRTPYLKRTVDQSLALENRSHINANSGLQIRFCLRTLHRFFVAGSEDWFVRKPRKPSSTSTTGKESGKKRFNRWHEKRFSEMPKDEPTPAAQQPVGSETQEREPEQPKRQEGKASESGKDAAETSTEAPWTGMDIDQPEEPRLAAESAASVAQKSQESQAAPGPSTSASAEASSAPAPAPTPASAPAPAAGVASAASTAAEPTETAPAKTSQPPASTTATEAPSETAAPSSRLETIPGLSHLAAAPKAEPSAP